MQRDQQTRVAANLPAAFLTHSVDQRVVTPLIFQAPWISIILYLLAAPPFAMHSNLLQIRCLHLNGCEVSAMMHFVI